MTEHIKAILDAVTDCMTPASTRGEMLFDGGRR